MSSSEQRLRESLGRGQLESLKRQKRALDEAELALELRQHTEISEDMEERDREMVLRAQCKRERRAMKRLQNRGGYKRRNI